MNILISLSNYQNYNENNDIDSLVMKQEDRSALTFAFFPDSLHHSC